MTAGMGTLTLGSYDTRSARDARAPTPPANNASLPRSLFTGSLAYTPIVEESYYCVDLVSPAGTTGSCSSETGGTIIDSGTSEMVLQTSVYNKIISPITTAQNAAPDPSCIKARAATTVQSAVVCRVCATHGAVCLRRPPISARSRVSSSSCPAGSSSQCPRARTTSPSPARAAA